MARQLSADTHIGGFDQMRVMTYRPGDVLRWTDRLGFDHDAIADEAGGVIRPVYGRGVIHQPMTEFDPEGRAPASRDGRSGARAAAPRRRGPRGRTRSSAGGSRRGRRPGG